MKNSIFRIVIVMMIVVGFVFLNGNLSTEGEGTESSTAESTTTEDTTTENMNVEKSTQEGTVTGNDSIGELNNGRGNNMGETANSQAVNAFGKPADGQNNGQVLEAEKNEAVKLEMMQSTESQFIRTVEGENVLKLLAASAVTGTRGINFGCSEDEEPAVMNVFAQEVTNCFWMDMNSRSISSGEYYQSVVFSTERLQEYGDYIVLDIGLYTGGKGTTDVYIYTEDLETPAHHLIINIEEAPHSVKVDISNSKTLKIACNNNSKSANRIVFYNLQVGQEG